MFNLKFKVLPPNNHMGFTLAETLIALVIVGVVAALTVPTMIAKYQKEQTVTRLKKAYSALSQTTQRAIADYGPIKTWEIGPDKTYENVNTFFTKYVAPYLKIMKGPSNKTEGGWESNFSWLNNEAVSYGTTAGRVYLDDGTSITYYISENTDTEIRIDICIDINGDKKPNKVGRDIFYYHYYPLHPNSQIIGKFLPPYSRTSRAYILSGTAEGNYACNKSQRGSGCSALIMKDGWQIKDDYPW